MKFVNRIIQIYSKAVSKVPILKYSWIFIATICILALIGFFQLDSYKVLIYAVYVILISFLGFLFSYIIKISNNGFIKFLLHFLITVIILFLASVIIGFGVYLFTGSPKSFGRFFENDQANSSKENQLFVTRINSILYKVPFNSSLCDVLTFELGEDSCQHYKYQNINTANECTGREIKYFWRYLYKSKLGKEFRDYLYFNNLLSMALIDSAYVVYCFNNNLLTRIHLRCQPETPDFDSLFIKSLIKDTKIPFSKFIHIENDGAHYIVGSSFQVTDVSEILITDDFGYQSCIHDWWHKKEMTKKKS